jgi:hypothetical protein
MYLVKRRLIMAKQIFSELPAKSRLLSTALVLTGALLTGALGVTGLTSCSSPTGDGTQDGHEHQWGATYTDTTWVYYTDTVSTADAAGVGHKIKTEQDKHKCTDDNTIENVGPARTWQSADTWIWNDPSTKHPGDGYFDLSYRVDGLTIDKNRTLQSDGTQTVTDPTKEPGWTPTTELPSISPVNVDTLGTIADNDTQLPVLFMVPHLTLARLWSP